MSNITGKCATCGCTFDVLLGIACPSCRVRKAFAPLDPLRTALGIQGLREDAELDGVWHYWHGEEYPGRLSAPNASPTEMPQGCKMPKSEEAQVYELKRLRKLIGKL